MIGSSSRLLCSLLALALATAPLSADDTTAASKPEKGRGDLFLKVATGLGLTEDSDLDIRQSDPGGNTNLTFYDVAWEDNSLSGPSARYTTVRLGYFLAGKPWMGVAVDFMHFKVFAEVERSVRVTGTNEGLPVDVVQPMNAIVERYIVGNGVNFLTASFLARKRLKRSEKYPHGRVQPRGPDGALHAIDGQRQETGRSLRVRQPRARRPRRRAGPAQPALGPVRRIQAHLHPGQRLDRRRLESHRLAHQPLHGGRRAALLSGQAVIRGLRPGQNCKNDQAAAGSFR